MHHASFQNVQSLINPLILDEPTYCTDWDIQSGSVESDAAQNVLANKAHEVCQSLQYGGQVEIENDTYFLGQENEVIDDEAASREGMPTRIVSPQRRHDDVRNLF